MSKIWVRAVWREPQGEEEGVIPLSWIKGKYVCWPNRADATKSLNEMREPSESWRKFELQKIKLKSGKHYFVVYFILFSKGSFSVINKFPL